MCTFISFSSSSSSSSSPSSSSSSSFLIRIGDAAGFQKYCTITRTSISSSITLTDISRALINDDHIDCVIYIAAKNNVGDPVINLIQDICETNTKPM